MGRSIHLESISCLGVALVLLFSLARGHSVTSDETEGHNVASGEIEEEDRNGDWPGITFYQSVAATL